jgi:hypothetical protein
LADTFQFLGLAHLAFQAFAHGDVLRHSNKADCAAIVAERDMTRDGQPALYPVLKANRAIPARKAASVLRAQGLPERIFYTTAIIRMRSPQKGLIGNMGFRLQPEMVLGSIRPHYFRVLEIKVENTRLGGADSNRQPLFALAERFFRPYYRSESGCPSRHNASFEFCIETSGL